MMSQKLLHRLIRQHFRVSTRGDNLPISSHRGTRFTLLDVWREAGFERVVEIGVNQGEFAAEILARTNAAYVGVDPWLPYAQWPTRTTEERQDAFAATKQRLREHMAAGRVTLIREPSDVAVRDFAPESIDAVFVDGDHTFDAVAVDLIQWSRVVRPGGIVALHDYYHFRRSGVVQAVDAFTHCNRIDPWFVTREKEPTVFWVKP